MTRNNARRQSKVRFAVGSKVTSRVTAQGLEAGRSYTVEAVERKRTFVGVFTTLTLRDEAGVYKVGNPHLVLQEEE